MINLGSIFVKSPFKPLREHMAKVHESVIPLKPFMEALHAGDDTRLVELRQRIENAEGEADQIKNEIRNHLPHRLFLPIDRRDLLAVLDMQDNIADTAQDISDLLVLRKMKLPEAMRDQFIAFIGVIEKACALGYNISEGFEALVEAGFGRHHSEKLMTLVDEVGKIESHADELENQLIKRLFEMEGSMNPVDVVFWYQLFGQIGDIADYTEKMANRLRLLVA